MPVCRLPASFVFGFPYAERLFLVIAGFLTGGSLAIRGGYKAARNSAIMCGVFLAVIEGVGIGFQRMFAENTRLDVSPASMAPIRAAWLTRSVASSASGRKSGCLMGSYVRPSLQKL